MLGISSPVDLGLSARCPGVLNFPICRSDDVSQVSEYSMTRLSDTLKGLKFYVCQN
jgi:hypothetical protein